MKGHRVDPGVTVNLMNEVKSRIDNNEANKLRRKYRILIFVYDKRLQILSGDIPKYFVI